VAALTTGIDEMVYISEVALSPDTFAILRI
jgi:hypothetical protein